MLEKLDKEVAQIVPRENSMEEGKERSAVFVKKERSRPRKDLLSAIFVLMENTSTMKARTLTFMMNGPTVGIALQEITVQKKDHIVNLVRLDNMLIQREKNAVLVLLAHTLLDQWTHASNAPQVTQRPTRQMKRF